MWFIILITNEKIVLMQFSQNPRLRRMLFATAGTTMVEASPMDNTWGIGLSADDPKAWLRRTWSGGNMLGDILTEVREELMEKFKNNWEDEEDSQGYKDFSQGGKYYRFFHSFRLFLQHLFKSTTTLRCSRHSTDTVSEFHAEAP